MLSFDFEVLVRHLTFSMLVMLRCIFIVPWEEINNRNNRNVLNHLLAISTLK